MDAKLVPSRCQVSSDGGTAMNKCGECKYNKRDWTNPNNPDFYCSNEDSDNYGYNTAYSDGCDDWEGQDG